MLLSLMPSRSRSHISPFSNAWSVSGLLVMTWLGALSIPAQGHQVPNMTIEAHFALDGRYKMQINVDPRVFLSEQPAALPPVEASWYRQQSATDLAETHRKAQDYLEKNVGLYFDKQKVPMPQCRIDPMDGATNTPFTPETAEVHLLATAEGQAPVGAKDFHLDFGSEAKVSLILLRNSDAKPDKQVAVVFPGESSSAFALHVAPITSTAQTVEPKSSQKWLFLGLMPLIVALSRWMQLRLRKA